MLIEFAHYCFVMLLSLAVIQILTAVIDYKNSIYSHINLLQRIAILQFMIIIFVMFVLLYSFWKCDFSLAMVATSTSSIKPLLYRVASLWSNYQGSIFLWLFFFMCLNHPIGYFRDKEQENIKFDLLRVISSNILQICFVAYLLFFANPFAREAIVPVEGQDLNPLLQDNNALTHPVALYFSYACLTMLYSVILPVLYSNKLNNIKLCYLAFYNQLTWIALTIAIALGGYWSYCQLGWGGYWSFDPVENSALLPWLASLAAIHFLNRKNTSSQMQRRAVFLLLLSFSLAILGSFVARSGLLSSVHSFAFDKKLMFSFFGFCLLILIPGWWLFFAGQLEYENSQKFEIIDIFYYLLLLEIIILVFCLILPIIYNCFFAAQINIESEFYLYSFIPIATIVLVLMLYKGYGSALLSHSGILLIFLSICCNYYFSSHVRLNFSVQNSQIIHVPFANSLKLAYLGKREQDGANYHSTIYEIAVSRDNERSKLSVEQQHFDLQQMDKVKVALLNYGTFSQLYIAPILIGRDLQFDVYCNYAIAGIWYGVIVLILGSCIKLFHLFKRLSR